MSRDEDGVATFGDRLDLADADAVRREVTRAYVAIACADRERYAPCTECGCTCTECDIDAALELAEARARAFVDRVKSELPADAWATLRDVRQQILRAVDQVLHTRVIPADLTMLRLAAEFSASAEGRLALIERDRLAQLQAAA